MKIYTDGSCHTQLLVGAWVAIILGDNKTITIQGIERNTTHNRMELLAVINALKKVEDMKESKKIMVCSDSQYVVNLIGRKEKLTKKNFLTNAGKPIQNLDLVKEFFEVLKTLEVEFTKIKAHQKNGDAFNRQADLLVRDLLRKTIKESTDV